MTNIFKATEAFNRIVTGLPIPREPTRLSPSRKQWTITALQEELDEFELASTIAEETDALIDLIYFAAGRLSEMGIDGQCEFDEVQRANMDKVKGTYAKRPGSLGYDAVKPPGWRAPVPVMKSIAMPKLLVVGHARHGKDTFCELLRDQYGFSFTTSSLICAEAVVYPTMANDYANAEECFADRANRRSEWYDAISAYLKDDPTRLGRVILKNNDIYCGVRNHVEYDALVAANLFDYIVWVDASARLPLEDKSSFTLRNVKADIYVNNNGDLENLAEQAANAARLILERKT